MLSDWYQRMRTDFDTWQRRPSITPVDEALPPSPNEKKPVVFVSTYKAGSSVLSDLLANAGQVGGYETVDFAAQAFANGERDADYCLARAHLLDRPGFYFGAFRFIEARYFTKLRRCKLVMQVRDPRDCIVSLYYSWLKDHALPGKEGSFREEFEKGRRHLATKTLDEYALEGAPGRNSCFSVLYNIQYGHPDCLVLKYEDMVQNFEHWFQQLRAFLPFQLNDDTWKHLLDGLQINFDPGEGRFAGHKRQVTPHEYRRKLEPATQEAMTAVFARNLKRFGYPLHVSDEAAGIHTA